MNNVEIIILFAVILLALFLIFPPVWHNDRPKCGSRSESQYKEDFTAEQLMQVDDGSGVSGIDPYTNYNGPIVPKGESRDYESLIYDDVTKTIMTGSQFMENTGLIAPPWVAPAWDPDAYGPSSKGELLPADYENDPRMLYNKCSLSCCSPQYPTPFLGDSNPFVCDKDGNNKYLASNYICQNNTGGTGCLCMTQKQVDGMYNGFVDYYVDKKNLGY